MCFQDEYNEAYEAGRASLWNEMRDYAIKTKIEEVQKATIVTVIWADCNSKGESDFNHQEISISLVAPPHAVSMVSMAMLAHGYDQAMINEALTRTIRLVGIVIGKVTWLE